MSYAEAAAIIFLSALASAGLCYAVHRLVRVDLRRRHQDVAVSVFLQLGVLFSVLLAFVFSEVYGEYGDAQGAIDQECAALHGTSMIGSALAVPEARTLIGLEVRYLHDVIERDWPDMRANRFGNPQAVQSMTELMQYAARLPVATAAEAPVKAQILALLSSAHNQREIRLYQAAKGLPHALWGGLIGFSVLLMTFVTFSSIERLVPLTLFRITFAVCVSGTLVLVSLLDYPFEGALAISPQDFADRLSDIAGLLSQLQPR
jgi:hypothetical protein